MAEAAAGLPVVWQGCVNLWECDQMEHWNTRFYLEALEEGLVALARLLKVGAAGLHAEVINVRFLREARLGANLVLGMAVTAADGAALTLHAALAPPEGGPAHAGFVLRVRAAQPVAVPQALRAGQAPAEHAPRDVPLEAGAPALPDLAAQGFRRIAAGALTPPACDAGNAMRLSHPMGRLSDGMALLMKAPRTVVAAHAEPRPERPGGVALEARFDMFAPAGLGDRVELWSAIVELRGKVFRIESWLIEPDTARPVASIRTVAAILDLDTRAVVAATPAARAALVDRGLVQRT